MACTSANADARENDTLAIDIAATTLPDALAELSRESGVSVGTEGSLPRVRTRPVRGRMSVDDALERLLAGTGLVARRVGSTAWRIERKPAPQAAAVARAETPAFEDDTPIIVTASKRRLSLVELPMAVSVVQLTGNRRLDAGSNTALVAGEVEGLALTALGSGRNRMFLRGIVDSPFNGESQSTVAVLMDEARLAYSAPDPDVRLVDVERVEVLKGPQGSLYGTGALGGIYHIVTRRADLQDSELTGSAGFQTVAGGDSGFSASAVANLPIVRDRAAMRLVGYSAREPGWIDTGDRADSNSSHVLGTRASLGLDAGAGWRLDATGFAQWIESDDSQYVYRSGARERPAQLPEPHDNDLRHLAVRLGRHSPALDVLLSTGGTWHEVGDKLDASLGAEGFGLADPRRFDDERRYRVWDSELRLSGKAGAVNWLFGISHVEARQRIVWTLSSTTASTTLDEDRRTTTDSAAFGDVTIPVWSEVRFSLGARLYRSAIREYRALSFGTVAREQSRTGVTPSAALSWKPHSGRLLYLRYGSAFRQGGTDISSTGQLEALQGDELATVEAGWREQFDGGGILDLGGHVSWWDHMQSDVLLPNGLVETQNAGDARIFGVELSFDQPLGQWRLEGGAGFMHAKLVRTSVGFELDDRHLPVAPEYSLRAAARHDFRLGQAKAFVRLQLRFLGPTRLSFDPKLDRPMGNVLESKVEAHAQLGGYELGLTIDNLFNRSSDTFAFGNPLRFAVNRQYTPQRPFSISLAATRRF